MKKEDFKKGQTVWVYLIGDAAKYKKKMDERVEEWEVTSVSRKYIGAKRKDWPDPCAEKFDISNDFRHIHTYGGELYKLFLTLEDIYKYIDNKHNVEFINKAVEIKSVHKKLSDEDLKIVVSIFKKYCN